MILRISRKAEEDLAAIYGYLEQVRPGAAQRFRIAAEKALNRIAQHPEIGPLVSWVTRHTELRFWVIGRTTYLIYYERQGEDVIVERVLDGRRNVHRIIHLGVEEEPSGEEEPDQ